jgi:hypothetical protein
MSRTTFASARPSPATTTAVRAPSRIVPPTPRGAAPAVGEVLATPGERLDGSARAFGEQRLGYDFGRVRVHRDPAAARSADQMGALAYTVGDHVVFGTGRYNPHGADGRSLLVHELAHVVQQGGGSVAPPGPSIAPLEGGGTRIGLGGTARSSDPLEQQAEAAGTSGASQRESAVRSLNEPAAVEVQQARVPLPTPIPMCGRTLTHMDVEPPRWRDLQPCKPAGFPVFRLNIVGRDLTVPTPGRGPQVFNLHIGVYRDPTTSRWCGIAHDSKGCLPVVCQELGCFPTLREVLDAIKAFLKALLTFLGFLALAILIALIIILLGEILVPAAIPILAEGEPAEAGEGGGAAVASAPEAGGAAGGAEEPA